MALGAIRLFLALSVVVWHLWGHALPFTANGYDGVLLFFIISGFYMSMVINDKYKNQPVITFYIARFLRIYPLYLLIFVLTVIFLHSIGKPLPTPTSIEGWKEFMLANIAILGIP